ncbi:MAG: tetratricopeptide repeat protein [Oscillatoriales cyanobacterium SM2_3_0]|nr:tetratricopeptide repeat protein [Oscillatoriales cyanobacterium SM2_3_0]
MRKIFAEAIALHGAGNLDRAATKYCQLLQITPNSSEIWEHLGQIYFEQAQYDQALIAIEQALELNSTQASSYYYLGLVLETLGDSTSAIQAYQRAIDLNFHQIEAHNQLGNLVLEQGNLKQAQAIYQTAIELNLTEPKSYLNLGNLWMIQHQIEQAIHTYQIGLTHAPKHPQLLTQLGIAFTAAQDFPQASLHFGTAAYCQQHYEAAIVSYQEVLKTEIGTIELYVALADCYQHLGIFEDAIAVYQRGLESYPEATELYQGWITTLQNTGQIQTAIQLAEATIQQSSDQSSDQNLKHIPIRFLNQRLLPILYENPEEIEHYRQRFSQKLTDLNQMVQMTNLEIERLKVSALQGISTGTNFYLQYQGKDDLELQQQYGQLVHRIMTANYPEWTVFSSSFSRYSKDSEGSKGSKSSRTSKQKIRIGYLSEFLSWHTVGLVFLGWVREFDRENFEVYCYHLGSEFDEITRLFQWYGDRLIHLPDNLEVVCQQIHADQLDILIFLDLGMTPQTTQIAGLRLAPIQCAAWGHPITTGLPTIDYYISADLLEPKGAHNHYSEQLICLPHLGIHYSIPDIPPLQRSRSDFDLDENSIIYLSCQSLFKYLPQYDFLFAKIVQQVPPAQIIFISHWNQQITNQFSLRLQGEFERNGLNFADHCLMLPRLNKFDYLQLNLLADIGLDTIGFTGFLTTLNSIACDLPVVTVEGEFMRGRQSTGILERIGVRETIAQSPVEYLEIAVRLGLDLNWRQAIAQKIRDQQAILYEDQTCIQALEKFYRSVTMSL